MKEFNKIAYTEYKDRYDESVTQKLHSSPDEIDVETMRAYMYGYTFTDKYAKGIFLNRVSS